MQNREAVVIKLLEPTKNKEDWLKDLAEKFSLAVQFGLEKAEKLGTQSRKELHEETYYPAKKFGLSSDYARMSVNTTVALARSYYKLRKIQPKIPFPRVQKTQGIGLGVASYKIVLKNDRFVLRVSTGNKQLSKFLWFPLAVPQRYKTHMEKVKGDAKLFQRKGKWYVMFPIRVTPARRSGEKTFVGVDLGIVRIATVSHPNGIKIFNGKEVRNRREHFHNIRKRYQRHDRMDRVRQQKGHESNWMRDINHKISTEIVQICEQYSNPVICFENLDGIRERTKKSKRLNRMNASWTFRQLTDMVEYKAKRFGIEVIFVDPRNTSRCCSKCGHISRANRPVQSNFRCVKCGYQLNADVNAARNISAVGLYASQHGPSDLARSQKEQVASASEGKQLDGASCSMSVSCYKTPTSKVPCGTSRL